MMRKLLAAVLFFSVLTAATAQAQDNNDNENEDINWTDVEETLPELQKVQLEKPKLSPNNGERQTYLQLGEEAPYAGVLLNPPAAAFIIAEYEALMERANAALNKQHELAENRLRLEVRQLKIQMRADRKRAEVKVNKLKEENKRLQKIHQNYVDEQQGGFWSSTLGNAVRYGLIVIGAGAVGAVVGFAAAQ